MFCTKCKKEIPEDISVCPFCNEILAIKNVPSETREAALKDNKLSDTEKVKAIKNNNYSSLKNNICDIKLKIFEIIKSFNNLNNKIFWFFGGFCLVFITVFIIFYTVNTNKYKQGIKMLASNNYQQAYAIFEDLGSFNDSEKKAEYAKQGIKYQKAKTLMDEGNYEEAIIIFSKIDDFKDAKKLYFECQSYNDYQNAILLMESESYDEALDLLYKVDSTYVKDIEQIIYECENTIKYLNALNALENSKNYEAYKEFVSLGDFKDSMQKASECIIEKPNTGVTYHNSDYKSSACSLTIKPSADGSDTYFRIYDEMGDILIANIFINNGDIGKIYLPAGRYILKAAYGYNDWFGETDMFGDDGIYQKIKVSESSDIFILEKNYDYTLTLRTVNAEGTPVSTKNVDKDTF